MEKVTLGAKQASSRYTDWTPEMDQELARVYPLYPNTLVAEKMGLSVGSVGRRSRRLGLCKNQHTYSYGTELCSMAHLFPIAEAMNKGVTFGAACEELGICQSRALGFFANRGIRVHELNPNPPAPTSQLSSLLDRYKRKAEARKLLFELTKEKFAELVSLDCHYCGAAPEREHRANVVDKTPLVYNGVDRKDPKLGYSESNCVTACFTCNRGKSDMTYEGFKAYLKKVSIFND